MRRRHMLSALSVGALVPLLGVGLPSTARAVSAFPGAGEPPHAELTGVATVSASDVWVVGFKGPAGGLTSPIMKHFDGTTWSNVTVPDFGVTERLNAVTAVSTDDVWAVGWWADQAGYHNLSLHWDGTAWSSVDMDPAPGSDMSSVATDQPDDAWAAAPQSIGDGYSGLIQHWDGTAWKWTHIGKAGRFGTFITGVSAISPSDAWFIGYQKEQRFNAAQHWDGTSWQAVSIPSPGRYLNELSGVTAFGPSDLWAVGAAGPDGGSQSLVEHWDGTAWTVSRVPHPSGTGLTAVAGSLPSDVWAVGTGTPIAGHPEVRTIIYHWNGTAWASIAPAAHPNNGGVELNAVSASSPTDAWAVGYSTPGDYSSKTFIEHWDGTSWTRG